MNVHHHCLVISSNVFEYNSTVIVNLKSISIDVYSLPLNRCCEIDKTILSAWANLNRPAGKIVHIQGRIR